MSVFEDSSIRAHFDDDRQERNLQIQGMIEATMSYSQRHTIGTARSSNSHVGLPNGHNDDRPDRWI